VRINATRRLENASCIVYRLCVCRFARRCSCTTYHLMWKRWERKFPSPVPNVAREWLAHGPLYIEMSCAMFSLTFYLSSRRKSIQWVFFGRSEFVNLPYRDPRGKWTLLLRKDPLEPLVINSVQFCQWKVLNVKLLLFALHVGALTWWYGRMKVTTLNFVLSTKGFDWESCFY